MKAIVTQEEWDKVQAIMSKKRTLPPALKHSKHTFSGLVKCAKCGAVHTFEKQQAKRASLEFQVVKQEIMMMILLNIKCVEIAGANWKALETLFYASLKETKAQVENYIDLIKSIQASGAKAGKTVEAEKGVKFQQIHKCKRNVKIFKCILKKMMFMMQNKELKR